MVWLMVGSMGEDNLARMVLRERLGLGHRHRHSYIKEKWRSASVLHDLDLVSHFGCVNAVEFDSSGDWLVSGGDDRRVLIWNVSKALGGQGHQQVMAAEHRSNIFCLGFDGQTTRVYSGGNDEQVIIHSLETGQPLDYFLHEEPVYGLSVHPQQANIFTTACSDGRVQLFDMRCPSTTDPLMIAGYSHAFHAVQFNPVEPRLLVTANQKHGMGLWDVRRPSKCVLQYDSKSSMHVSFNRAGTRIVGLRRRLPPILFDIASPLAVCEFDHPGYYNSCTMKSCCFGGTDDEFVLSGSDDFNVYMWRICEDKETSWLDRARLVLRGHRSIVNQVRYNRQHFILASSGVEKIVKIWSPLPLQRRHQEAEEAGATTGTADGVANDGQRNVYTHEGYIGLVLQSETAATQDVASQSTSENPRMMAFFDSLVQREIEGWDSDDDGSTTGSQQTRSEESTDEAGVSDFSHFSMGRRRRELMERVAVSIANDLVREEDNAPPRQEDELDSSRDSTGDIPPLAGGSSNTSNLDTTIESVEGGGPMNRITQLIAMKRAHLVATQRSKRPRTLDQQAVSRIVKHAKKLVKLSSNNTSSSDSGESWDEDNATAALPSRLSAPRSPLTSSSDSSSPSSPSPSSSSPPRPLENVGPTRLAETTNGLAGHLRIGQPTCDRLPPETAASGGQPPEHPATLGNGDTPPSPSSSALTNESDRRRRRPQSTRMTVVSPTHSRHSSDADEDDDDDVGEGVELSSLDHLLPGPSVRTNKKFIQSLRRKRSRILGGAEDSDDQD